MAGIDLPYKVDYAKSARAKCRGCKKPIDQGCLRLAVMVQSAVFDGRSPNWYHDNCFFIKQRPKTSEDIHNFETIRWEDQQEIKKKIESSASTVVPGKKGKKRDAGSSAMGLQDFKLDYAASSRAMCRGCEIKIMKGEIRIAKKDFESDVGKKYGGQDMWHHLTCFAQLRSDLGYYECGDKLTGFQSLNKEGQADVKKQLPAIKQEDIPAKKKPKTEDEVDGVDKKLEQQTKDLYKFRDQLEKNTDKKDWRELLEKNSQTIPIGPDRTLDKLADMFVFGSILPCPQCKDTNFVPGKEGYVCKGNTTEWSKCDEVTKEPKRKAVLIPKQLKEDHSFLKQYKYKPRVRVFKDVASTVESVKKEEENAEPRIKRDRPPLYNMTFVILGNSSKDKVALKEQIGILGGKVTTAITKELMAVISTVEDVEKDGARMQNVRATGVHVVPESFLDKAKDHVNKIPELIKSVTICDWGTDPTLRLPAEPSKSGMQSKSHYYTSKIPTKQKLTLIGGAAVDPDSGLDGMAHVYIDKHDNNTKYSVVLGLTDIQLKKNSFYKIQLLEADIGNRYWVFRSWGRIGTTIGGTKVTPKDTLHDAKEEFEEVYLDKTENHWESRAHFQKKTGKMYPVDVDYGEDEAAKVEVKDDGSSKLAKPVQDLIKLIFNVNSMKNLMMEFELDMEKMPLGKLSKAQIKKAYSVLTELQNLIDAKGTDSKFMDASNRFYTFIPHSFGIEDPPILKNNEIIKQKIDMLDNLLELEIAFSMMKSTGDNCNIDSHYFLLKTDIEILPRDSVEFSLLQEYVTNTHAATHAQYKLEIINVFTIARHGEEKRFKPFKKLHNRQLLWHGSRITNFAGILSQGLRIAPPEAPVTGYMFGKGIYFADMVSKSANYCCTNHRNPTGLLLLCDVALGDMYERKTAEYVEKLPKGKHSCKGVGRTQPDPKQTKPLLDTGVDIPLGTALPNNSVQTQLLYNEFIVYDIAQVNVKYMLQMNFKY